jgi:hypothetical protein
MMPGFCRRFGLRRAERLLRLKIARYERVVKAQKVAQDAVDGAGLRLHYVDNHLAKVTGTENYLKELEGRRNENQHVVDVLDSLKDEMRRAGIWAAP